MRYDKDQLKESLTIEDIKTLLTNIGAEVIVDETKDKNQLITNTVCHNHSGGSMKLYYFTETRTFRCFTHCSTNYDVYSLVQKIFENKGTNLSFTSCISYVARITGRNFGFGFGIEVDLEDNANEEMEWMDKVSKPKKIEQPEIKYYDESILDVFSPHASPGEFIHDNISSETLNQFGVKYYDKSERIVLVNRHWENGKIIGLRGRIKGEVGGGVAKYLPLTIQGHTYSFPTFINLFGLWENQSVIRKLKKVIVFESEKSVMQCSTYFGHENNFSVALSGRNISQAQIDILLSLGIEEIQLALDKGFEEVNTRMYEDDVKFIVRMGRKFAPYVRTYTLFDDEGLLDFKDSPSDKGADILKQLMATKKEILNKE